MSEAVRNMRAVLRLQVDEASFARGDRRMDQGRDRIERTTSATNRLSRALGGAALAYAGLRTVRGVAGMVRDLAEAGDRVDKFSQQVGVSTSALQELEFAAERSGVGVGELRDGLARFQRQASDAFEGRGEGLRAFRQLGIDIRDASGALRSGEDLFSAAAEEIAQVGDEGRRGGWRFRVESLDAWLQRSSPLHPPSMNEDDQQTETNKGSRSAPPAGRSVADPGLDTDARRAKAVPGAHLSQVDVSRGCGSAAPPGPRGVPRGAGRAGDLPTLRAHHAGRLRRAVARASRSDTP